MFKALLAWFRSARRATSSPDAVNAETLREFETLNRQAPLKAKIPESPDLPAKADTFVCRETILGREQRIAGHHFMLRESTRNRIRHSSRLIHHVYTEVLIRELTRLNVAKLLGHRLAFIDVPDSFLEHACLQDLSPTNTVLVVNHFEDAGAPTPENLRATIKRLQAAGFSIGIDDPHEVTAFAHLLPEVDFVLVRSATLDPQRTLSLAAMLKQRALRAKLFARDLTGMEDFTFCFKAGVALFQGPFITSREDWRDNHLSQDTSRLAMLLARLRQDADTAELVELTKHDPSLSFRLLRFINSAASGMAGKITSIDHALQLIGRDRMYRWLMLMFCAGGESTGRSSAALESALVRARFMELASADRSAEQQEAFFLAGLLSLIDVILKVPLEKAIAPLGLSADLEQALLLGEGPYGDVLKLAIACERGDGDAINAAAEQCGMAPGIAFGYQIDAMQWALDIQA
jgi:EAL and modified HD-GYP domain-containing signal transduction protein